MHGLMDLAMEVDEDVTSCESKDELIQIRLASEKVLLPGGQRGTARSLKKTFGPRFHRERAQDRSWLHRSRGHRRETPARTALLLWRCTTKRTGRRRRRRGHRRPRREAGGREKGGESLPLLGDWNGVSADRLGRVTMLELQFNSLKGAPTGRFPSALGRLTALQTLHMHNNQLGGVNPPELGWLTALTDLGLQTNRLTGAIPPELGKLTALRKVDVSENHLSGSIPRELSQLTDLSSAWFIGNHFDGDEEDVVALLPDDCAVWWDGPDYRTSEWDDSDL
ncbi:unnamed protein product [Ectocarpus sp. 12 AP-2014]